MTERDDILGDAQGLVSGDRAAAYGDAHAMARDVAALWSVILSHKVEPWQVFACMDQLKLVRVKVNPKHRDSWVDRAGYTALAAEVALRAGDKS